MRRVFASMSSLMLLVGCSRPAAIAPAPDEPVTKGATAPLGVVPVGAHRFQFSEHREHSCSMSMESHGTISTFDLVIDDKGNAKLTEEVFTNYTFGPSFGAYKSGHHEFTHDSSSVKRVFAGKASPAPGGFEATLDQDHAACTAKGVDGCKAKASPRVLRCHPDVVEVELYAKTDAGPTRERVEVVRCQGISIGPIEGAAKQHVQGGYPFGPNKGIRLSSDEYGNSSEYVTLHHGT